MRGLLKKVLALILVMSAMLGCMSLAINAEEVRGSKYHWLKDPEHEFNLHAYMHYYYDSSTPSKLTKVAAIADLITFDTEQVYSGYVYIYNTVDVLYSDGTTARKVYRSKEFKLSEMLHIGESHMMADPLKLSSTRSIVYVVSYHGVCTYNSSVHTPSIEEMTSDNNGYNMVSNVSLPLNGERILYQTCLIWPE